MARNQFGCICDICGKYTDIPKEFYRLKLPTYESELDNSTQYKDCCFNCYGKIKQILRDNLINKKRAEYEEYLFSKNRTIE